MTPPLTDEHVASPCPVDGCDRLRRVSTELLCPRCWFRVPRGLRNRVLATWYGFEAGRVDLDQLRAVQAEATASVTL